MSRIECFTFALLLSAMPAIAQTSPGNANVRDFGAVGDGQTDDTAAFHKAMESIAATGGIVHVPAGHYLIATHLTVPNNVTLQGVWVKPPASTAAPATTEPLKLNGSVLLAVEGAGEPEGHPFITLGANAALHGMTVFYPNQQATDTPVPYPWTIRNAGDDVAVIDVLLVNPYQAIDFGTVNSGRHFIRNLYAQAIYRGIYIDRCYDIGRIENVHLWPFWEHWQTPLKGFTEREGKGFIIGRTDWEHITNCFCIGYQTGFEFITSASEGVGGGNVLITGGGPDICPVAIHVRETQRHSGMSFANCQIFGDVIVEPTHTGLLKFTGCGFFGSIHGKNGFLQARLDGAGRTSFSNCHFWPLHPDAASVETLMDVVGGRVSIVGCLFEGEQPRKIVLHEDVKGAVIVANEFGGPIEIVNQSKGKVEVANNIDSVAVLAEEAGEE